MAVAKVILNGETLMDVTSDTPSANNMLDGIIATKNDGTKVTGNITNKSSTDLTVSGATVTAPAGYYANAASKAVSTTTHPNPSASITSSTGVVTASHTQGTGYVTSGTTTSTLNLTTQAGKTVTPTETAQTAVASYRWTTGTVSVAAISSTYVGTGVAKKSSADLTASDSTVTAPAGYYSIAATKSISAGSAFPPAVTITKAPTFSMNSSTGVVTASYTGSSSITPTVTAGYISQGTAGTISTSGTSTYQLITKNADNITASTANQTISSYRWLTGAQTILGITTTNLSAENIKSGVTVKVGDTLNSSRITQITGTYAGGSIIAGGYTADQIATRAISGAISGSALRIYNFAFNNCQSITTATFPSASIIGMSAFAYCISLTSISFPSATNINAFAFFSCTYLTEANFPLVQNMSSYAFSYCTRLSVASFPSLKAIASSAFYSCYNLLSLYLMGSSMVTLSNVSAFYATPISTYTTSTGGVYGSIFVPTSLYNSYITATNWATYSARIVSV